MANQLSAYELADEAKNIRNTIEALEFVQKAVPMLRQQADRIAELEKGGCGNCHACLVGVMENGYPVTMQRMIVCPDCGNKRCPKASNHRHQCTGSNEPNQRGSIYTTPQTKPLSNDEILEMTIWNKNIYELYVEMDKEDMIAFARAIEERHGIK